MGIDPFSIIMFVASTAYQQSQQRKMKKKQAAAAEARKGFEFTNSGDASPIPVAYGKNLIGGNAVKHHITSGYTSGSLGSSTHFAQSFANTTRTGTKNEYLHVQYALCQDGIEDVQSVKVNDLDYNDGSQRFSHSIRTFRDGDTADAIATANGIASTNTFTGTAYASATFKLDRDDPQYNGSPSMGFLVKGRKVRAVELNTGVYSLAASYVYSNNPALCLLDYMLNTDFGRGITVAEVDLQSFYEAAVVCGTTVSSGRSVAGLVNGGVGTRDIPLYECNITLDTDATIRDNIQSIMSTMAMAELTWSSEGKYKLLVEYPTTAIETDALVDASHYFTDDDIVRDDVNLSWPSASDRFNQATVSFINEHEDFKSDSMTWPKTGSTAHTTYLTEDNQQPFVGSTTLEGVTDPYHALAAAEQIVRQSRSMVTLSMTVTKKGLSLEPGDFINVTSTTSNISDEVYRVESIEVMSDFTVRLSCYFFDYTALAWNVNDDIAYSVRPTYDFAVEPVTSLAYTAGRPSGDHTAIAELTWTAPTDGSFKSVVYYTDGAGDLVILGETSSSEFYIYPRDDWTDGESVTFTVKAQTPLGRLSTGVSVTNTVVKTPPAPTTFGLVETLYQTNKAAGVKARATISFVEPSGGVEPKDYKVEYYRDEDGSTYQLLGYTVGQTIVFNDIRAGNYHFRITPISWFDDEGIALVGTQEVLGLTAVPSDPAGFTGTVQSTGIILSWTKPTDLDVLFGGHTQIRFARDTGTVPNWPDAQVLVNQVDGNATSKSVPFTQGYFLIKHFDSTGNESASYSSFLNTFAGANFNQVADVDEAPTFGGTKTNCTVVGSELVLDAGQTSLEYQFTDTLDLGEVVEVTLAPNFVASSYDLTLVSSYPLISALTSFAGADNTGSVSFEVRRTDDDPTGTPTWTAWEPLIAGFYNNRAFQVRLNATVTSTDFTVIFTSIGVTVDKADITKSGQSTSSASADTTVTYTVPFYGGINGLTTPRLGVNIIGGSAGDNVVIATRTKTGFSYSVYDDSGGNGPGGGAGGSRVARDVDWQAIGQ